MSIKIIAEIGINHNGDMDICKKLIKQAKECGCDAVKFQKRDINLVYSRDYLLEKRDSPWGKTQRDQKEGLELSEINYQEIDRYSKKINIDWFASAWDLNSQKFLKKFDLKYNKIASAMIIDEELLNKVAEEKRHTFISTGMSSLDQIQKAVDIFKKKDCSFELMHTVSSYPMPDEDANLKLISFLREKFNCDVGYSGHESGIAISIAASTFGITSLERHFTLDRTMYGSDQSASLEPAGMRQLVGSVRKVEVAIGDGVKKITKDEENTSKKLRAHIKSQV